jgi:hypothetical protein
MQVGPSGGAAHAGEAQLTQQAASQLKTEDDKEVQKATSQLQAAAPRPIGNSGNNIDITV